MTRLVLPLLVLLLILPRAAASLSPRPEPFPPVRIRPDGAATKRSTEAPPVAPAPGQKEKFQLTDQTEIFLDGRPCRYRDVPASASVVKMEMAEDKRTILTIHFHTKK